MYGLVVPDYGIYGILGYPKRGPRPIHDNDCIPILREFCGYDSRRHVRLLSSCTVVSSED